MRKIGYDRKGNALCPLWLAKRETANRGPQTCPDGTFVKEIDELQGLNRAIRPGNRAVPGSPVAVARA
jgi:hypothetical protein